MRKLIIFFSRTSAILDALDGAARSMVTEYGAKLRGSAFGNSGACSRCEHVPCAVSVYAAMAMTLLLLAGPPIAYSKVPVGMLDTRQPVDRMAAMISSNEGESTSIDWNDNGAGVSIGIFQANQKVGQLPELLHEMSLSEEGNAEIVDAFGPKFAAEVKKQPEVVRTWHFGRKTALGAGLKQLVQSSLFTALQVAMLRRKVENAAQIAARYGIISTEGVAICADLTNQWGDGGAQRFLRTTALMKSEEEKVKAVVSSVSRSSKYGSRYKDDLAKVFGNGLSFDDRFDYEPST